MRTFAVLACLLAACQSTRRLPEGQVDTKVHPEFDTIRPVIVAVLPVSGQTELRLTDIRRDAYDYLFHKRYSPLMLDAVDARTSLDGEFSAIDVDWDATFEVEVSRWDYVRGADLVATDARAALVHRTGETLWECTLRDYPLDADAIEGFDENRAAGKLVSTFIERLPRCPPLSAAGDVVAR